VATIYKVHYVNVPVDVEPGLTDLDGTTEEVYRGPHASKAWNEYRAHKDRMIKLVGFENR
jgi:hypothetical protein